MKSLPGPPTVSTANDRQFQSGPDAAGLAPTRMNWVCEPSRLICVVGADERELQYECQSVAAASSVPVSVQWMT